MILRFGVASAIAGAAQAQGLETTAALQPASSAIQVKHVTFAGRAAIEAADGQDNPGDCCLVDIAGQAFHDGVIDAWVAGRPTANAPEGARGFVGLAFRVESATRYEAIYFRPTNGRADDQLRRNHSIQYISEPEYPWQRLRQETPGQYETYADLQPGKWFHVRIEVSGDRARLYLDRANQPAFIVDGLKHGPATNGGIALWVGPYAECFFADIRVTRRD